jgi:hypothetical protein
MVCKKTVTLTGTEQKVEFKGRHCDVRNDGAGVVYVSCTPGVEPDADGVLSIPPGQAVKYCGCRGVLYLLGEGKVLICGNDYSTQVFRGAATSTGSGEGGVSQTYVDMQDADTLNKANEYAEGLVVNDNLLINPDFSINQRGQTVYSGFGYTVDGWFNQAFYVDTTVLDKGVRITYYNAETAINWIYHTVESLKAGTYTLSVKIRKSRPDLSVRCYEGYTTASTDWQTIQTPINMSSDGSLTFTLATTDSGLASGDWIEIEWAKLEPGTVATPFVPPNPATEQAKCQRYLLALAQSSAYRAVAVGTDYIDFSIPTPTTMRPISGMSIANSENFVVRSLNPTVDQTGFTFNVVTYGANQLRLRALKTAHSLTDATLAVRSGKTVLLSAEL